MERIKITSFNLRKSRNTRKNNFSTKIYKGKKVRKIRKYK